MRKITFADTWWARFPAETRAVIPLLTSYALCKVDRKVDLDSRPPTRARTFLHPPPDIKTRVQSGAFPIPQNMNYNVPVRGFSDSPEYLIP